MDHGWGGEDESEALYGGADHRIVTGSGREAIPGQKRRAGQSLGNLESLLTPDPLDPLVVDTKNRPP
jgi:hypothetical protein